MATGSGYRAYGQSASSPWAAYGGASSSVYNPEKKRGAPRVSAPGGDTKYWTDITSEALQQRYERDVLGAGSASGGPVAGGAVGAVPNLLSAGSSSGSGGGGYRSGGGGGGGGGGAAAGVPGPEELQGAYQEYLRRMMGALQFDNSGVVAARDSARSRFRDTRGDVRQAYRQGSRRVGNITSGLGKRNRKAKRNIDAGFRRSLNDLNDTRSEFMRGQNRERGSLNNVLSAFGAGSVKAQNVPLSNLFAANKLALKDARGAYRTALQDRGGVYAALGADVRSGLNRDRAGFLSRAALGRDEALRAAALQASQGRAAAQREMDALLAQVGLEAAQQGLSVKDPRANVKPKSKKKSKSKSKSAGKK